MKLVVAMVLFILSGCASSPVAPSLREGESDGGGQLAHNCKNVRRDQIPGEYITNFYLTTWGSVFAEALKNSTIIENPATGGTTILARMPAENTFCMVYPSDFETTSSAVAATVGYLSLPMKLSSEKSGEFETEFDYKEHDNTGIMKSDAKWRVRFLIFISDNIEGGTDVRVYRDIAISRGDANAPDGRSPYISATSDGHNEAWYLLQVDKYLTGKAVH